MAPSAYAGHSALADSRSPIIAGLGLIGVVVGLAMARRWAGVWRKPLLAFAWAAATALALLIPDYRVLVLVAYAPIVLIGSLFGSPPGRANLTDAAPWPVVNQFLCIGGGLAWAAAAVSYGRLTRGACASCGRSESAAEWTRPEAAARWGRWAVGVAVLVPILYAVTRWAWALGMPLGITEEFLREGQASGLWLAGRWRPPRRPPSTAGVGTGLTKVPRTMRVGADSDRAERGPHVARRRVRIALVADVVF